MSSSSSAKRAVVSSLQGPRPLPLSLPGTTTTSSSPPRPGKRHRVVNGDDDDVRAPPVAGPVIVYEYTPKVIHARPDEFKALVQRLTGRQQQPTASGGSDDSDQDQEAALGPAVPSSSSLQQQQDPLVLTLGQQHQVSLPLDDHHHNSLPVLPSPGGAGFLLSPGSFLFSPTTMQAIHELIS